MNVRGSRTFIDAPPSRQLPATRGVIGPHSDRAHQRQARLPIPGIVNDAKVAAPERLGRPMNLGGNDGPLLEGGRPDARSVRPRARPASGDDPDAVDVVKDRRGRVQGT
jgi:hypothetical protein